MSFALIAGLVSTQPANAISGPNPTTSTASLFESEVVISPESLGRIERDAVKAARTHLNANAASWGVDPNQFQPSLAIDGVAGISVVRFVQRIADVAVANSLLAITVNRDGSLLSYTKSISDYSGASKAVINESQATNILKSSLAQNLGITNDQVIVSEIELVIVDSALVDNVPSGKYLAWRAATSVSNNAASFSMTYLSQDGKQVLSSLPFVRHITAEPFVCDLQVDMSTPGYELPVGVLEREGYWYVDNSQLLTRGYPLCGDNTFGKGAPTTEAANQNIVKTMQYFNSVLGQDISEEKYLGNISVDGDQKPRISAFTNVCATDIDDYGTRQWPCPYRNAFWVPWNSTECSSGACSGIFIGKDFDNSDDVIAHELAHGVTFSLAFNAGMNNQSETAALSEAISDIFGEAMDQLNVVPGEVADPAWTIGEDYPFGYIRKLRDPTFAKKIDKYWITRDGHDNTGPANRLAFLLANGGTVDKVKVVGLGSNANSVTVNDLCDDPSECLGTVRMSQLVFATTSNLTATASFFDFGRAMNNACFTLLKAKAAGFTTSSCKSVQSALIAQGFTSSTIAVAKVPAKAKQGKPFKLSATMNAVNGTKVSGQKLALQVLVKGKWVTKQSTHTNASGKAAFSIKLFSKREYKFQIVSYSYSGMYSIKSNQVKTKVS